LRIISVRLHRRPAALPAPLPAGPSLPVAASTSIRLVVQQAGPSPAPRTRIDPHSHPWL